MLGQAAGHTITLDANAAGWGWFVDHTPNRDSEFVATGDQGELNHMDLLSVVMHELGHLLGHDHETDGVMEESLAPGVRRTNSEVTAVDQVFGQADDHRSEVWLSAWLNEYLASTPPMAK